LGWAFWFGALVLISVIAVIKWHSVSLNIEYVNTLFLILEVNISNKV
jgi:hypothetical protein